VVSLLGSSYRSFLTAACLGQTLNEVTRLNRSKNRPTSSNETVAAPLLLRKITLLVPFYICIFVLDPTNVVVFLILGAKIRTWIRVYEPRSIACWPGA
jgi:hypothetical protein